MTFIHPDQFAKAFSISKRAARMAFCASASGKTWHGETLAVVQIPGRQGGASGSVWALKPDACSPNIRARLDASLPAVEGPLKDAFKGDLTPRQFDEQAERLAILTPILKTEKRTAERAEAFRNAASRMHVLRGKPVTLAENTLRDWVLRHEGGGTAALLSPQRADKGKSRVLVTREWDAGIDLCDAEKARIAAEVVTNAKSMITNDGASIREVIRLSEHRLFRLSDLAGATIEPKDLTVLCKLNTKWATRNDLNSFRMVYLKNKDHKAWQDKAVVRMRCDLHPTPMGLLIGDVHYVDILIADGKEPIRARLIGWIDASSSFAFVTPVFLSKGQGIRQEDVAKSLAQVTQCPHGGIPGEYYLDNGSEYSALSGAMARLSTLADLQFKVTLAKPYSPTSKGEIEGFFNVLEGIFKGLPGWIGGDRTNKKSVNRGQVIAPYSRGLPQLEADIQAAVAIYNSRPQSGRLKGLSPKEMLERKIAATGFEARRPSEEAFDLIFSRQEVRTVRQGCINIGDDQFHGAYLDKMPPRASVEVLIPLLADRNYVFVRQRNGNPVRLDCLSRFAHGDREGAKLQARLEAGKGKAVRELEAQIDKSVSTFENQKAAADFAAPNAPSPENWTPAIDKTTGIMSDKEFQQREDAEKRAVCEGFLSYFPTETKREASGGNR